MEKLIIGFCIWLCAGVVNAALIDFDNLPGGGILSNDTNLTNQYAPLGVTFSASENGSPVEAVVNDLLGSNYWWNCNTPFCNNRADVIRIDFDTLVENVSWVTDAGTNPPNQGIIFNAYNSADNIIETFALTDGGSAIPTAFLVSGISYIEMLQARDDWGWGIDNLAFDQVAPIPAPAPVWLFSSGLMGLWRLRKNKP